MLLERRRTAYENHESPDRNATPLPGEFPGHTKRYGLDPTANAEQYVDRIFDVHIKDVSKAAADGGTIEIGRGVIDIPRFLRTIIKLNYQGIAAFEFEKDANDPLPGVAESVGYVRGVLSVI